MPGAKLDADLWMSEYITPHDVYLHGVTRVLVHQKTPFQEMTVVESGAFGKALVLDGKWQSCTGDEFLYHEPLVHPACALHDNPQNVLVLGGGEGATVREVLKWNTVVKVVMIDIDSAVVEACKLHLPEMHQGAFDDPRTELVIGDALAYLDRSENEWDIIISDLSDPIEEGPSYKLFTREYFAQCCRALKPDGFFVVQAGPVSPVELTLHARIHKTVLSVFNNAISYASHVPSYSSPWGFVLASTRPIDSHPAPDTIDNLLNAKTTGKFRTFDGITFLGLMQTPKYIRDAIAAETSIYTLEKPPIFFGAGDSNKQ